MKYTFHCTVTWDFQKSRVKMPISRASLRKDAIHPPVAMATS